MSFYICVFSNIFAKQIYSFINAQGQIKIFFSRSICCKIFFFMCLCPLLPFKYEKSAYTAANVWENEHGRKGGGDRVTLKEFQESYFPASKLNYWKCKLNFLKYLLNSKRKEAQKLSKSCWFSFLVVFPSSCSIYF